MNKEQLLQNHFYTDSAHKAYEQALFDIVKWLVEHNKRCEVKEFALAFPFFLEETDYWALRERVGLNTGGKK